VWSATPGCLSCWISEATPLKSVSKSALLSRQLDACSTHSCLAEPAEASPPPARLKRGLPALIAERAARGESRWRDARRIARAVDLGVAFTGSTRGVRPGREATGAAGEGDADEAAGAFIDEGVWVAVSPR